MNSETSIYSTCGIRYSFYEAAEFEVIETGFYTIIVSGISTIYGYIFKNNFDVFKPDKNLISEDFKKWCGKQFGVIVHLQINTTYVLLVTTSYGYEQGNFSVLVIGPNNVRFNFIGEYVEFYFKYLTTVNKVSHISSANFFLIIYIKKKLSYFTI